MPYKCSVPRCKGNFINGPSVHVFPFPQNKTMVDKWLGAIKASNFKPSKSSRVCELHFHPEDIDQSTSDTYEMSERVPNATLLKPRLCKNAIPSLFPNCPSYLSSAPRESPDSKRRRREENAIQNAIELSVMDESYHEEMQEFATVGELKDKLNFLDNYWTVILRDESLLIGRIVHLPKPKIRLSTVFDHELNVHVFINDVQIQKIGDYNIPSTINDVYVLEELLNNLRKCYTEESVSSRGRVIFMLQLVISILTSLQNESSKFLKTLNVICEQLHMMTLEKMDYSRDFLIFSSLLNYFCPQGYKFLRNTGYFILPNCQTVARLTLEQTNSCATGQLDSSFMMYITNKSLYLTSSDKNIALIIDEINIQDSTFSSNGRAKTAFVFTVNSLGSKYKDVVHVLLTNFMTAENLFFFIKKILIGLDGIGFRVICVLASNKDINKRAISLFTVPPKLSIVYPHPADSSRSFFFMFDSLHLLKCIRNSWFIQKDSEKCMKFPSFCFQGVCDTGPKSFTAPYTTLKKLYYLEAASHFKYGSKLTFATISSSPSVFEKHDSKFVLQIFNEYVIQALQSIGEEQSLPFSEDVAQYIKVVYVWWTIMNVKTPHKGCHKNKYATPLTNNVNDEKYVFLTNFCSWLDLWDGMTEASGKLTNDTFIALKHTTQAIIELTNYCINELNLNYILTGKFQTDELETRFGSIC